MQLFARAKTGSARHPRRRSRALLKRKLEYWPAWLLLAVMTWLLFPDHVGGAIRTSGDIAEGAFTVASATVDVAGHVVSAGAGVAGDAVTTVADAVGDVPALVEGFFASSPPPNMTIAPLFTGPVDHWSGDIARWAAQYGLDPNLLATVMQIESCGHPTVTSSAGARGLFQVMPFHFLRDEDHFDPNTNARRGAQVLSQCLAHSGGDVGLALACYNGGPSVTTAPSYTWNAEVRAYYTWGTGIYADALTSQARSATLDRWLAAGGQRLCSSASAALGIE